MERVCRRHSSGGMEQKGAMCRAFHMCFGRWVVGEENGGDKGMAKVQDPCDFSSFFQFSGLRSEGAKEELLFKLMWLIFTAAAEGVFTALLL